MSDVPYGLIVEDPPHFEPPAPPPPPPPPAPPSWPPLPSPPKKRRPVLNVLAGIAIFVLFVLLGSAVGAQLAGSHTATPTRSTSSGGTTTGTSGGSVAAAIDPAVVDITTTLDGGQAAGTGMVISADGLVLTNNHVIEGATAIKVQIGGSGPTHVAHIVGYSVTDDVAVIQIEDVSGLRTVTTGDSSSVEIGDRVTAIGNALGRPGPHAVTSGKITALDQEITAGDASGNSTGERLTGLIEFNASLQPGDSGGVLVNRDGDVVGMNTAASLGSLSRRSTSSAGYAIPINHALDIAHRIENGEGSATIHIGERGILGIEIDAGTSASGVTVAGVSSNSPADDAGIAEGDRIQSIDGKNVRSRTDIQAALNPHHPGDTVDVRWIDGSGQTHTASITLEVGPPA